MKNQIQVIETKRFGENVTQFYNKELSLMAEVYEDNRFVQGQYEVIFYKLRGGGYNQFGFGKRAANYACACLAAREFVNGKVEHI